MQIGVEVTILKHPSKTKSEDIPQQMIPGSVEQLVMCLATDACLTANPRVSSLIMAGLILSWRLIMK